MFRSSIKKRLTSVSKELASLRNELSILDEQLGQVVEEADDLRLRSIVSETPQAAKEHRDAAKWVATVQRERDEKVQRVSYLETKQDELLDQLTASS